MHRRRHLINASPAFGDSSDKHTVRECSRTRIDVVEAAMKAYKFRRRFLGAHVSIEREKATDGKVSANSCERMCDGEYR